MSESKHFCFRAAKITQEWDKTRPNQEKNAKKVNFSCKIAEFRRFRTNNRCCFSYFGTTVGRKVVR